MTQPLPSFRLIPTFGRSTIRTFHRNASAMKKLAARDFEDLLQVYFYLISNLKHESEIGQCIVPVLEGLFENQGHNRAIMELVYILAEWHCNAKLRLHTDHTLNLLDKLTTELGTPGPAWVVQHLTSTVVHPLVQ